MCLRNRQPPSGINKGGFLVEKQLVFLNSLLHYRYMAKTITLDAHTAKELIKELERFDEFKMQILSLIPQDFIPEGSKLWWEKAELEADEDIKKGRVVPLTSLDDLDKPINKLFS